MHPTFGQGPITVSPAVSLAMGGPNALRSPALFLKVFQVIHDKTVTNKVSLNFHFFLPRAISLKIYQRIPFKILRALSFSLRSRLWVLLSVVQQISVKGKLFKSIQHRQSLGTPDFILSVIRNCYKILFISKPKPRRFTNNATALKEADFVREAILELLAAWQSCRGNNFSAWYCQSASCFSSS